MICAQLSGDGELCLGARGGDDFGTHQFANINRGQSHSARGAVYEQGFTGLQACSLQTVVGRVVVASKSRCSEEVDAGRQLGHS